MSWLIIQIKTLEHQETLCESGTQSVDESANDPADESVNKPASGPADESEESNTEEKKQTRMTTTPKPQSDGDVQGFGECAIFKACDMSCPYYKSLRKKA